jgi:hypothetical protein
MEGTMKRNGLVQVRLNSWIDYLKLREWKRRMESGGIEELWELYEKSLNPEGEQSYKDFCDAINERYIRED